MDKDIDNHDLGKQGASPVVLRHLLASVAATVVMMAVLVATKNPGDGGPMIILLFLFLTFLLIMTISMTVIRVIEGFTGQKFSWLRVLYTSVAIAVGFVFLVGLRTLRQLQVVDVVLVITFELLLNFYLLRRF
jgi:hypothetical protein